MTNDPQASLIACVESLRAKRAESTVGEVLLASGSVLDRIIRDKRMTKVWRKLAPLVLEERCRFGVVAFAFVAASGVSAMSWPQSVFLYAPDPARAQGQMSMDTDGRTRTTGNKKAPDIGAFWTSANLLDICLAP